MSQRGEDFDAKQEAYNSARQWLYFLIDHPDKTVPVNAYKAQLKDAKAAVDCAHKALMSDA